MPRKHLTKKERQALLKETSCVDGEPFTTMKGLKILCNALIDDGSATLERGMETLQSLNARERKPKTLIPCSFCAKKIGLHRCAGCSRTESIRYCSRECQLAAWPQHKAVCASSQILDAE